MSNPASNADEIKIRQVTPCKPGAGTLSPGSLDKVLIAREAGRPAGCDIVWVRSRRAFRVDHFEHGKLVGSRWIPEGRVDEFIEAT